MRLPKFGSRAALAALLAAVALPAAAQDLQMWERTGGNAGMVDALVAAWNEKNPDRKINLTYIPHTEMVPKLAQAIASRRGARPDGHGPDLRPAVRGGRPARGHHRHDQGLARRSRPRAPAT